MRSNSDSLLLEVNSSPGLEGIETATGKDIAGMVISSIERNLIGRDSDQTKKTNKFDFFVLSDNKYSGASVGSTTRQAV